MNAAARFDRAGFGRMAASSGSFLRTVVDKDLGTAGRADGQLTRRLFVPDQALIAEQRAAVLTFVLHIRIEDFLPEVIVHRVDHGNLAIFSRSADSPKICRRIPAAFPLAGRDPLSPPDLSGFVVLPLEGKPRQENRC